MKSNVHKTGNRKIIYFYTYLKLEKMEMKLYCIGNKEIDVYIKGNLAQIEDSLIASGRGRSRKTIDKTIEKDLEVNGLFRDMIYDRML